MSEHAFVLSTDPRKANACGLCGRRPEFHAAEEAFAPARDPVAEGEFLLDVIRTAQRLTGIRNSDYAFRVLQRLALGRKRYGDDDFLHKDNLSEVCDEPPDIAGYALLELQKQNRTLDAARYANLYQDLLAASAYACVSDFYAQRASRRLVEVRG